MGNTIKQGVHCYIDANDLIDTETGQQLDVTGYPVHAVAAAYHAKGRIIAEWHTNPVGTQGLIVAGGAVIDRVRLHVTPSQTSPWTCAKVVIQAEMTNPADQTSRIIDRTYDVSFEAVV